MEKKERKKEGKNEEEEQNGYIWTIFSTSRKVSGSLEAFCTIA